MKMKRQQSEYDFEDVEFIPKIQKLINAVGLNGKDSNGVTPLHLAAAYQPDAVLQLVAAGVDVNPQDKIGRTPLHLASRHNQVLSVKNLLEAEADVKVKDVYGRTPLHSAKEPEVVSLLVFAGADVNAKDGAGETPLFKAIVANNSSIVEKLISLGADVNSRSKKGLTPMQIAVGYQNPSAIKMLFLAGGDVRVKDEQGRTLLHYHLYHRELYDPLIIPLLLELGLDVNSKDNLGQTPLHHAVDTHPLAIKPLIDGGADINSRSNDGRTPLHLAARKGNMDSIKLLLQSGADIAAKDNDGYEPYDFCSREECDSVFEKYFWKKRVQAMKRTISGERTVPGGPLPQLPGDVWEYILHKKMHKELCENLQNENNMDELIAFAEKMQVPWHMLDHWQDEEIPKKEICDKLARMLSIGAFYSKKGMEFLLRREQAQKGLGFGQQFLDTLTQFGISVEGKTLAELLDELNLVSLYGQ